jgi:hypothetical protein
LEIKQNKKILKQLVKSAHHHSMTDSEGFEYDMGLGWFKPI